MNNNEEYYKNKIKVIDSSDKYNKNKNNVVNIILSKRYMFLKYIIVILYCIIFYYCIANNIIKPFILVNLFFIFFYYLSYQKDNIIDDKNIILKNKGIYYDEALEYLENLSKYLNKDCYCGSQKKYKKCCRKWDNSLGIVRHLKNN